MIFLLGIPRSGTTLVVSILIKGQDNIGGVTLESHFFNKYKLTQKDNSIIEDEFFNSLLDKSTLSKIFHLASNNIDFFKRTVDEYLKKEQKIFFVEKTPQHVFYYKKIAHNFPNSNFIIVRRNVFANIQSLSFSQGRGSMLLVDRLGLFKNKPFIRYMLGIGKYFTYNIYLKKAERHTRTIMKIYFEDLVNNPDKVKSDVEKVLNVTLNTFIPTRKPASRSLKTIEESKFHVSAIDSYKSQMPEYIQYIIKKTFLAEKINYVKIFMHLLYLYPFYFGKLLLYWIRGKKS